MSDRLSSSIVATKAVFADISQVAECERARFSQAPGIPPELESQWRRVEIDSRLKLETAMQDADLIRATAQKSGYDDGFTQGYQEGLAAAAAQSEAEQADRQAAIEGLLDQIEAERRNLWLDAEPQIVSFVLEVAGKVIKQQASADRSAVVSTIRAALRRVIDLQSVRIRVNIADLEAVRQARDEITPLIDGNERLEIIEDRRVSPGGAMIETNAGIIDARIEPQLAEIESALQEEMRRAA